ncbi:unnamed protein product [Somion occarium]|uniref:Ribonuclease PIN domain-containing protein n=1 Tax=Somion occarium TaxID=3059160 RepID=A0ABP1D092_9APHY
MATTIENKPACKSLVLDAGPLLSLSPLRGLAETFYIVPQVLDELKDKRAREHFEKLGLSAGVRIQVQSPDTASLAHAIQFAKQTGDYSVLSHADLCVLALTYGLDKREKEAVAKLSSTEPEDETPQQTETSVPEPEKKPDEATPSEPKYDFVDEPESEDAEEPPASDSVSEGEDDNQPPNGAEAEDDNKEQEKLDVELHPIRDTQFDTAGPSQIPPTSSSSVPSIPPTSESKADDTPVYDDPSDEDDEEGEWITPSNVALHKSKALHLVPDDAASKKGKKRVQIGAGCMTADFAMQNVLLKMGLSLVGVEGKRIERVKTWVLRCHACFKCDL